MSGVGAAPCWTAGVERAAGWRRLGNTFWRSTKRRAAGSERRFDVRRIDDLNLWTGDRGDVRDLGRLRAGGIAAVVDLALDEPALASGRELVYCRYPLLDGAGNPRWLLAAAVGGVASLVRARAPTLVVCSGGMSRAPSIAAAGVAVATGEKVEAVLERIAKGGGPMDLSAGLWRGVCAVVVGLQLGRSAPAP